MERGGGGQEQQPPPPPNKEDGDQEKEGNGDSDVAATIATVIPADKPLDPALLPEGDPDIEIESLIIPALERLHTVHIRDAKNGGKNGDA